jgi:hypothetical protein
VKPMRTAASTHEDEDVAARDRVEAELDLLRAKAAVCDAYRDWLETPRPRQRWAVGAALLALSELEQGAGKR